MESYFSESVFESVTADNLQKGEYENCEFARCNLADADLSGFIFVDCHFSESDLSSANLNQTSFKTVQFENCKLLGLRFDHSNPFLLSLGFKNCQMNYCSFYGLTIPGTMFIGCQLEETDFSEANLGKTDFSESLLRLATFDNTDLSGADLRSAFDFQVDPERNTIKNARFSRFGLAGLLGKYDIKIE